MSAKATLEQFYAGVATGDLPAALALLAGDVEWIEAEGSVFAGTYRSPDEVLNGVFARIGGEWDDFRAIPDLLVDEDAHVVAIGTYSGTFRATGRAFEARFAHVVTVSDGVITHFEQIVDSARQNAALS